MNGYGDSTFPGEVHLFDGSTWQLRHTFENPTPAEEDRFGRALAAAGNKVLVGAPFDDTGATDAGAAYLFVGFPRSFTTLTDAEGNYTFTQLEPGPYRLGETVQADYFQWLPGGEGTYSVTIGPDDVLFDLDFGNLVNHAPQAADDGYDVVENTTLTVTPGVGVLKNDSDPDSDPLAAVVVEPAAHGTLTFQADGSFAYTALAGFYGVDQFTYKATDGMVQSEAATVTITIRPGPELLMASDKAEFDAFGYAVAIDGDYIAVGAYCDDTVSFNSGSVYVYQRHPQGNWTEVAHLTASDGSEHGYFGMSVALDGDRMVIGACRPAYEEGGAAYIFERQADGEWAEVAKLLGDRDPWTQFGISVALRGDRIVVGANEEDGGNGYLSGTAYVFERAADGTWSRAAKLIASDGTHDALFGRSVAIDGDYLVVGAMYDPDPAYQAGSAYVFHRNPSGQWTEVAKLNASDGAMYDYFGLSVAIDGDTVVVGAHGDDDAGDKSGAAYVFQRQPGGTTFSQVAKLAPAQPFMNNLFGRSVAIYDNYILVGAVGSGGSTYVFHREPAGQWQEIARFRPTVPGAGDEGHPVAVSATLQAVAGVPLAYLGGVRTGAAYVFNVIGNEPPYAEAGGPYVVVQGQSVPLDASRTVDLDQDNTTLDYQWDLDGDGVLGETGAEARYGNEIGISPTFSAAAIDRPGSKVVTLRVTDAAGIVDEDTATVTIDPPPSSLGGWVFEDLDRDGVRDPGEPGLAGWHVEVQRVGVGEVAATLSVPTTHDGARLGEAVATLGNNLLVGAPRATPGHYAAGAAYLFDNAGNLLQTFANPTPEEHDYFGQSIAALGDKVAVGCPRADEGATGAGAVYLFDSATGQRLRTFQNPTPGVMEEFGSSVATVGDRILVGCPRSNSSGPSKGAVYLFNGATGNLLHTFRKPMPDYADAFGHSLASIGDNVLIGDPFHNAAGLDDVGAVCMFDSVTGDLLQVFENPTPGYTDYFGWAIAAVGDDVLISARNDDTTGRNTGIVYLFDTETGDLLRTFWNSSPQEQDLFGSSVAVVGNSAFIGCRNDGAKDSGAVYMFDVTTGELLHTFPNPAPGRDDHFGWSVAAVGDYVLVGTPFDDTQREDAGAAYLLFTGQDPVTLVSGLDGYYSLSGLDPGRYVVRHIVPSAYYQTLPGGEGTYTVTLADGGFVTDLDFGAALNTPPVAGDDSYVIDEDQTLTIEASGVLENDADADGHALSAVLMSDPSHGSLTLNSDGSFQYVPEPDYNGTDEFKYAAHDGYAESNWATVTITINQVYDGSVSGTVFEDLDDDGVRDPGEPGLEGWTVELTRVGSPGTVLQTYLDPTSTPLGNFGWSVAALGNNVLVGSHIESTTSAGAAYLFEGTSGALLRSFVSPTPSGGDDFGFSVAAFGNNVLVGAPRDDTSASDAGAAYLFDSATGALLRTFLNPAPDGNDQFGHSVAAVGDYVLVGAPLDDRGAEDAGAAYLFDSATGELLWTFESPAPAYQGFFGWSVAGIGQGAVVGSPNDSQLTLRAGAVHLFDSATGSLLGSLRKPLPAEGDQFGYSLATAEGRILIGAIGDDANSNNSGAAYLFDATTGNLLQPFFNPDANWDDKFGSGVALVGENVLIGAPRDQTAGFRRGIAYLFHGPTGRLLSTLENPSPETTSHFGFSVAALGNDLLIGSLPDNSGAVFLFRGEHDPITTVTDAEGNYEFAAVPPGVYAVAEILPATYRQTFPAGQGSYTVSMVAEESILEVDFGNWQPPAIVARSVFYNDSAWDGDNPAADTSDVHAIAPDKNALLPGETADFANYTTYSRGINGVIIDIAGLADQQNLNVADDFEFKFGNDNRPDGWSTAATPAIDIRPGKGQHASDRVTLIWEDNAIPTRSWLEVRVKATPNTGLDQDEVFYFGNAVGDADGNGMADEADILAIYDQVPRAAAVDDPLDIDRDGATACADMYATYLENGQLPLLDLITVPSVVATGDAAATDEDTTTDIAVLGNDRDVDGNPLSVEGADATSALGASVTINPDGTLTYDPSGSPTLQALATGEIMEDTFSYMISDIRGGADTRTVTVTVSGVDEPEGGGSMKPLAVEAEGDGGAGDGILVGSPVANRANGSSPSPAPTRWIPAEAAAFFPVAQRPINVPKGNGRQVHRRPGPRAFDHGPAPLAMSLGAGQDAGRRNKARAHDAVMEEAAERESLETWLAKWDWIWWYDFEQMRMKKRSSNRDNLAKQAADEFLASWRA